MDQQVETKTAESKPKSKRGFASMDKEKLRAIARRGGASVPSDRRSFSQSKALASAAGRKGGAKTAGRTKKVKEG